MEDFKKTIETMDIKDKVVILKGVYSREMLTSARIAVKALGGLGIMNIQDEDTVSSVNIDEAISYLQKLKEKSNG